jgi:hypothetical protein
VDGDVGLTGVVARNNNFDNGEIRKFDEGQPNIHTGSEIRGLIGFRNKRSLRGSGLSRKTRQITQMIAAMCSPEA